MARVVDNNNYIGGLTHALLIDSKVLEFFFSAYLCIMSRKAKADLSLVVSLLGKPSKFYRVTLI